MNLIICTTPLQVLIAEKIIELYSNENFYGIMLIPIENEKYENYAQRLRKKCQVFGVYQCPALTPLSIIYWIKELYRVRFDLRKYIFKKIFLASIDKTFVHSILDACSEAEIFTFDDGTANIMTNSFLKKDSFSYKLKLLRSILNINTSSNRILNSTRVHFTIYSDLRNNVVPHTKLLKIFNDSEVEYIEKKEINILLGQPIFKDYKKNIILVKKILSKYSIDYYFPHPREDYIINDIQYINTDLIFEDYFYKNFLGYKVNLFTFFSSSAIHILCMPNVKVKALYDHSIGVENKSYLEVYDLFERLNIEVIKI